MKEYITKNQKQLKCGITTGTCAAAAAKAAAERLLLGIDERAVFIHTPKGMTVEVAVSCVEISEKRAEYRVQKDSGDDPDVTDQAWIHVCVEKAGDGQRTMKEAFRNERYPNLYLEGGCGVGRVTKEGLEQRIGQPAINAVPRSMIFQAAGEVCELAEYEERLLITVSVPEGEKLAEHTFNPRLGITGGISILGTSGILEPMSEKAIVDTIETQIRQMQALGEERLLVTPGNYGQGYAGEYLGLDLEKSIKCSNYIGATLDLAISYQMKYFLLVGNIGKLVKLAAGIMNTHSKTADARCEIFAVHTVLCGGSQKMAEQIMTCINTDEILSCLEEWGLRENVMQSICGKIEEHIAHRVGDSMQFGVILFSEKFGYLGQTKGAKEMIKWFIS